MAIAAHHVAMQANLLGVEASLAVPNQPAVVCECLFAVGFYLAGHFGIQFTNGAALRHDTEFLFHLVEDIIDRAIPAEARLVQGVVFQCRDELLATQHVFIRGLQA